MWVWVIVPDINLLVACYMPTVWRDQRRALGHGTSSCALSSSSVTWRSHMLTRKCLPMCHQNTATQGILYVWRIPTRLNQYAITLSVPIMSVSVVPVWSSQHHHGIFKLHSHPRQRHRFVSTPAGRSIYSCLRRRRLCQDVIYIRVLQSKYLMLT